MKKKNITETNNLFRAACVKVAVCIRLKKSENRKKNEPRCKSRIDEDIKRLKQNSNFWKENPKENWEWRKCKLSELNQKCREVKELKQKMLEKSAKVRCYEQRIEQLRHKRIFEFDQREDVDRIQWRWGETKSCSKCWRN